jgi:threonine/homoserine/homoserine lactone efflux protein
MAIFYNLINIFILGLIGGANPGPILISSCTESLKSGFAKSLKVIWWALIAESVVAAVILLAIFSLNPPKQIFYFIALIGGAYLSYIAWQVSKIDTINEDQKEIFAFKKIFALTLLNGPFWLFWITICVPLAFEVNNFLPGGQWLFLFIFELGWLISTVILVFIFSRFRSILTKGSALRKVYILMAIILFYLAFKMIINSIINLWQIYV